MATENVGSISASLELQTGNFEKGIAKAEKKLDALSNKFEKSQQRINGSLIKINANVTKSTTSINKHLTTLATRTSKNFDTLSTTITKSDNRTRESIKHMEKTLVAELKKMTESFKKLQQASNKNFTKGIDKLANTTKTNTTRIVKDLRKVELQAESTKKTLNKVALVPIVKPNIVASATPQSTGGFASSFSVLTSRMNTAFDLMSKIAFKAFLFKEAIDLATSAFGAVAIPAINFASSMENLRLGYAGIISSTMTQNGADIPYEKSLTISEALIQRMQDEALKTSLTIEELGTALQSSMAMGLNAGMSLDKVLDLTVVAAQAVKTFGLSNQQVIQEIRGLISGDAIRPGVDQLATVLGYTTATVNQLREEGKLYEDIMERMKGFKATSEEFQNSWAGLVSNLQDGVSRVAGEAGKAFFKVSKDILADFQKLFFDLEKVTLKGADGKEFSTFKVILNADTMAIAESFYNIMANLLKVFKFLGEILGAILVPMFRVLLDCLDGLSTALVIATIALTPLLEGLKIIGKVIMDLWDKLVKYLSPLFQDLSDELVVIAGGFGVLAIAVLACTHPFLALIALVASLVGTFSIVFKNLKKPVDAFSFWLDAKLRYLEYRFKENKAMLFGDMESAKWFNGLANTAYQAGEIYGKSFKESLKSSISNSIDDIKQIPKNVFDNLAPKFPANKSAKSGGGTGGSVVNPLEKAIKSLEKLIDKINNEFENLIGVSDKFFKQDLETEKLNRLEQLKNGLQLVQENLVKATGEEKALWETRQKSIENAIEKEKILADMKERNRQATQQLAEAERLNLLVREQSLDSQFALRNSEISDIKAEEIAFNIKKKYAQEYLSIYKKTIQQYKEMAKVALENGSLSKFNEYSTKIVDLKEKILDIVTAINPVEKALRENLLGGISDAFQAMAWQEKSAKEALEDLAVSFTKTWTKMLFDTAVKDMFNGVFGDKNTLNTEIEAQVNVNTSQFNESLNGTANYLTGSFLPALQQIVSSVNGSSLTQGIAGNLIIGGDSSEESLNTFTGNLKITSKVLDDLSTSVKANTGEVNTSTKFAIPMMIASVLNASGALGKFGTVLQHLMMIMQIAQSSHIMGFATGGYVSGAGTSTSDSIPAKLSNGEYVLNAKSVSRLGVNFLDKLNAIGGTRSSRLPKFAFASGGYVSGGGESSQGTSLVMNNVFQSLDPEANMKMMQQMYPQIRSMYINDLQNNTSVRNATRGAVK